MSEQTDLSRGSDADSKKSAIRISVVVGALLLVTKFWAWKMTGSTAVFSDAMESIINVAASLFALFTIYVAAIPADENHPYGHGKIEYFSAGFEGALIVCAAIGIIWVAVPKLFNPQELTSLNAGTWIMVGTALVNLALGTYLLRSGRQAGSPALVADGRHVLTDVWTTGGVVVGLLIARFTGWLLADPIVAILLAINILFSGWRLIRTSAARLLDEADDTLLENIVGVLKRIRRPGFQQPHQLRATSHGSKTNIDFHVFMPRFWDLETVHNAVDSMERNLAGEFGVDCESTIHVDPCRPRHCNACELDPCEMRSHALESPEDWNVDVIKSTGAHPELE